MAINRDAHRALAQSIRDHAPEATTFCSSSLAAREPALSAYARSKRAGEDALRQILGTRADILRPAAVYGPGDRETLIFFQLARLARVPLLGNERARISVIQVEDLCAAIVSALRSEEHTSELQSLMRISYAVFCLKKKIKRVIH